MKILRTLLVLLLCAVLPLSGLAASGLTGGCPMQATMGNDAQTMRADMLDCASSKTKSADKSHGVFCKAPQCQSGSLYHPVSIPTIARPAGAFRPVVFHYAQSLSAREPDGFWRPPRTV